MKISVNWLKDYVTVGATPEKLADKLTMAGHEVEKIFSVHGDAVFEMEITPNRPDCLSLLGMARETAAILGKPRKFPKIKKRTFPKKKCDITIEDKDGCSRYIGILIEGVSIQKAPEAMTHRLASLEMRPINNAVDITNFCMMEMGQPMHAFDYDKLEGGKIIVRRARKGEKIITLDDDEVDLDPSILVIADAKKPVAIAGIMGGKNSEVTAGTKNILLESAYFNPVLIRRASRKLAISTDSSYRFERGVDYNTVATGSNRGLDLLLDSAGGSITKYADVKVVGKKAPKQKIIISKNQINARIGISKTGNDYKNILKKLDFEIKIGKNGDFNVLPPSFRGDIKGPEDIIEEVSRIIGYDNVPITFPQIKVSDILSDPVRKVRQKAKDALMAQGFNEMITYTMVSRKILELSGQDSMPVVDVFNPLSRDQEIMRPSVLPGALAVVLSNVNRGQKDLKLFEMGKVYTAKGEKEVLATIMTGLRDDDWRQIKKETVDYYDLKGAVEQALCRAGIERKKIEFQPADHECFEEGQSSSVTVSGKNVGFTGKIDQAVLDKWGIKQKPVLFAQVEMDQVYRREQSARQYISVPEFPSISRDISLAVPMNITARDIERAVCKTVGAQKQVVLAEIKFIEKYEGDKISKEYRGLIFSLTYRSNLARTLRDEEATQVHDQVCDVLVKELGVIRR